MPSKVKKSKVDTCTRASGHLQIFSIWFYQSDLLCSPSTHTNFELIWTKISHSYSSNLSLKSAETGITHRYICPFSARKTSLERGKQGQHSCAIKSQKIQSGHLYACKWPLTIFHTQSGFYTLYSAPANFELIWTSFGHSHSSFASLWTLARVSVTTCRFSPTHLSSVISYIYIVLTPNLSQFGLVDHIATVHLQASGHLHVCQWPLADFHQLTCPVWSPIFI